MTVRTPELLRADDTALLVIDVQERFRMQIAAFERMVGRIRTLVQGAALLDVPVVVTEQYPQGLGPTVAELAEVLDGAETLEKRSFSAAAAPGFDDLLRRLGRRQVVLVGLETHVCVLNTALDLLALDFRVYLAIDAVGARYRVDHDTALRRLERAGAVLTTSEGCVFEWVGGAGHPRFKDVSRLVQERMKQLAAT